MAISRSDAFFRGINPYTGESLPKTGSSGPVEAQLAAPAPTYSAPPQDVVVPAPVVNPDEVLNPLYNAQQELSKAKAGLGKVRQHWNRVESEVRQADSQTNRAQSDLYPAESDTEETDHSRTGGWANRSLDQIERSISRLQWDSSGPTSAIYDIKQQLNSAQSYLNSVDSSRLPYPWRHQQAVQNLNDFQSRLYRIEQAQSQLESKLSAVQSPLSSARYDLNQVENDREGVSVAYPAQTAKGHLSTVSQQLQQVEQHLRYSNSDLSQAEGALSTAEQSVQTAHQEYQYSWHTSDRRA